MSTAALVIAILTSLALYAGPAQSVESPTLNEDVYVEAPFDSDQDGDLDRIYVSISRPGGKNNLPAIFTITPYAFGGNNVPNHNVDVDRLPQDENLAGSGKQAIDHQRFLRNKEIKEVQVDALERGYASVSAHSVGTGYSGGCPSVGDEAETLATKAVIDWLNGRARAFSAKGREVAASWASGSVGMVGVSYNGTLPNMVATTGVEGLNAIIPIAAISSWYDYYRANGLVVGPGGYVGEDADILGKFIVRRGTCQTEIDQLSQSMGREHGDYSRFWQDRDYVGKASQVRAAVFIMHGQSDWNVRQRHAIQWWNALALEGNVPLRMWLHRGGHATPNHPEYNAQKWAWFDRYVKGVENGVENEPKVEVQARDGTWRSQDQWPNETTVDKILFLNADHSLSENPGEEVQSGFTDIGSSTKLENLIANPREPAQGRLAFLGAGFNSERILSGTPRVHLSLAVMNRKAANITVALVDYDNNERGRVVTRGWADPQNHSDLSQGELLIPGREYQLSFDLEPKQYIFSRSSRIGVIVTATDYDHTLRPSDGTQISVSLGETSYLELRLSEEHGR